MSDHHSSISSEIAEEQASAWLQEYGAAWEHGDADRIVELFAANGSYRVTPFDSPLVGHDAIRQYWLENPATHVNVEFSFEIVTLVETQCFCTWASKFIKGDRQLELRGLFRLIFQQHRTKGLLCETLQEWWHERSSAV